VNQSLPGDQAAIAASQERYWSPDGTAAVLWRIGDDMKGRLIGSDGQPIGDEFTLAGGGTYTYGAALDGGGFVFAYSANGQVDIAVTAVDANGVQIGSTYTVNSGTFNEFVVKEIAALAGGGYILFRESGGLVAQKFDANAALVGSSFQVSQNTTDITNYAQVDTVRFAGGGIFVVWSQYNPESGNADIFGRFLDSSGNLTGSEIVVSDGQSGSQSHPELTLTSDGRIAVAWLSGGALHMRYVEDDGSLGSLTQVSTSPLGPFGHDGVATPDGGVYYAWRTLDSSGEGVAGRHIGANGVPTTNQQLLNVDEAGNEFFISATSTPDGGVFVSWFDQSLGKSFVTHLDYSRALEDEAVPISVSVSLTDNDRSEVLQTLVIDGLPDEVSLAVGERQLDGTWLINRDQSQDAANLLDNLAGGHTLTLLPDENFNGQFTLSITATSRETANGDEATSAAIEVPVTIVPVNDAPEVSGPLGNNHVLSSSNGYVPGRAAPQSILLSDLGISGDGAITVEFWFNGNGDIVQMPFGFYLYDLIVGEFDSGSGRAIGFNSGSGDLYGIQRNDLDGQWHHIVAVFDNGNVTDSKLYIDGVLQPLTQLRASPSNGNAILSDTAHIGGVGFENTYSVGGQLDEFRIWHGERTAQEIADNMNVPLLGPQPGLVASYSFENVSNG